MKRSKKIWLSGIFLTAAIVAAPVILISCGPIGIISNKDNQNSDDENENKTTDLIINEKDMNGNLKYSVNEKTNFLIFSTILSKSESQTIDDFKTSLKIQSVGEGTFGFSKNIKVYTMYSFSDEEIFTAFINYTTLWNESTKLDINDVITSSIESTEINNTFKIITSLDDNQLEKVQSVSLDSNLKSNTTVWKSNDLNYKISLSIDFSGF